MPTPNIRRSALQLLQPFPLTLLGLAALVSCWPFVAPGHPFTFDVWPHLARQKIIYEALRDGFSPVWSFMFYSGYPHLRFYSPLFYVLGGLLTLATGGNILLGLRILLVIIQLMSAAAMYWYLGRRTSDARAAALGSIVYLLVPWRFRHMVTLANYPQILFYLLLPLLFLVLDRLMKARPQRRNVLLFGLLLALAVVSHVVYAAFAAALLLIALITGYAPPAREATQAGGSELAHREGTRTAPSTRGLGWKLALELVLAGLVAVGLSSFFLVPFLAEYRTHAFPQFPIHSPPPDLLVTLGLTSKVGGYTGGYLGLSIIALLAAAIYSLRYQPPADRRRELPAMINLIICLLLVFIVPLLGSAGAALLMGLLPERFLLFFMFFAAALIAGAYRFGGSRVAFLRKQATLVFAILVAIVAIDCVPTHLRVHYFNPKEFLAYKPEVYREIRAQNPAKILDLNVLRDQIDDPARTEGYPAMGFIFGNLPTPLGPFYHQFASRAMLYGYPWINQITVDLADTATREVAPNTSKALALLGVSHLILEPKLVTYQEPGGPKYDALLTKEGVAWDSRFVKPQQKPQLVFGATGAGLALASNVVRPLAAERYTAAGTFYIADDWRRLLDTLKIERNRINFIAAAQDQPAESLPGLPDLTIGATRIRNQDVTLEVTVDRDCFVRLAVSYYPELEVMLDGRNTGFHETKDHFIWLRCPAGTHRVGIVAPLTPLRRWMLGLSGLALLVCLAAWVLPFTKAKR